MATMYAQPAAANYYAHAAQAHFGQKSRGYRLCDQCGAVENPAVLKFRLCGGCMTTQYCSSNCQKLHWTSHKPICQHTASQIASTKQPGAGYAEENLAKHLRKFTSAHQNLLNWTGFQALQLKRAPGTIRTHALLIELDFVNSSAPESLDRFSVNRCSLIPRSYITSRDPLVAEDIQRREDRCRAAGGIGALVILIQCGGISQVMPVEVDPPASISWDERRDWEAVFRKFVADGRTDFMPISTTPQGVFYG